MRYFEFTEHTSNLKFKTMKNKKILLVSVLISILTACGDGGSTKQKDTCKSGIAKIMVEESFKPLFETSCETFESFAPAADIQAEYMAEGDIIQKFYEGKIKTICISRDLNEKEKKILKSRQIEVRSDKIAIDGVALIVNPDNKDTSITVEALKQILIGKKKTWNTSKQEIKVVFDKQNSANFNYMFELTKAEKLSKNVFAVNSNKEVIDFVKKNKSAIGVIGLNWVSDEDDFEVMNFLDSIKVMHVAKNEKSDYFQPYPGVIYTFEYPLTREIWMINWAPRSGINSGFVNFMIGEKGQLLIQKSELVPARSPIRLIQISTE
jgi:phosphate transport system substrate-binding protein